MSSTGTTALSSGIEGESVLKTADWSRLAKGECTELTAKSAVAPHARVLDCALPHGSEVYATFTFPENAPPSRPVHDDWADTTCRTGFDAGVPRSLTYIWFGPGDDAWKRGDRAGLCLAVDPDGGTLTAPLSAMPDDWTATPDYPSSYSGAAAEPVIALLSIALALIMLVSVLVGYLLFAFALTSLFRKVGVPVWKAWVPYVQIWTLLRLGGVSGHWVWLFLVPYANLVAGVFLYIAMYRIGVSFNKNGGMLVLGIFLPFAWAFVLGGRNEVYRPDFLAYRGFPPPLDGYGSIPRI